MNDALAGVRVVEVASWMFVPSACAILAEWGADVIKVEDPERGDPQRGLISSLLAPKDGVNYLMEIPNRGKRSVGVNIKTPQGRAVLSRLLESADVFVTNHLPQVRQRLGIDVEHIRAERPDIVYVRGSAYGPHGPEAERGGFDVATYWARGGIANALTPPGSPRPIGPRAGFGDLMAGMALAGGVAAALLKRQRTGIGSVVDVSLLGLAMWQIAPDVTAAKLYGDGAFSAFDPEALPNPLTGTYATADGRFVTLMMIQSDVFWPDLCAHLDIADLVDDPRFRDAAARHANSRACMRLLADIFRARPLAEWETKLRTLKGVWAPVATALELHRDQQVIANNYLESLEMSNGATLELPANPVQFDERPASVWRAPEHGEHTEAVLLENGFSYDEILALKDQAAVL